MRKSCTFGKLACDLKVGDIVFYNDYPVEVERVSLSPCGSHVLIVWGSDRGEWIVLRAFYMVEVAKPVQPAPVWTPGGGSES